MTSPVERLSNWFDLATDGILLLKVGKVELGQGILTAISQIAAQEIGVDIRQITVVSGDTALSPNQGGTVGSMSIETSVPIIRSGAQTLRRLLVEAFSSRHGLQIGAIDIRGGHFVADMHDGGESIWHLASCIDFDTVIPPSVEEGSGLRSRYGESIPIAGLNEKIGGGAFIHDMKLPRMLHGRVLRKPHLDAHLKTAKIDGLSDIDGVVNLVHVKDFVGIVAESEHELGLAMDRMAKKVVWQLPAPDHAETPLSLLEAASSVDTVVRDDPPGRGDNRADLIERTFTKPLIGHGSIGPSCGIAIVNDDGVNVWSHSQNVFALRDQVARVLNRPPDTVRVRHAQAAGCYGHNGADDAAMDAAMLAATVPGRAVRVLWTRKDELTAEPLGSPMRVRIRAAVADRRITKWELESRSGTHIQRPGWNDGVNLLAPAAASEQWKPADAMDLPPHNGGSKNAVALYDIQQKVTYQFVPDLPFRLSALRSLGAFANVFAIESMMDDLARLAGVDPVAFRLDHLSDPRARTVITHAADMSGWDDTLEPGLGKGLGFARFKNTGSYCAVVAQVEVGESVSLRNLWAAVDAGFAINPLGIVAQVEGGMIQAASWTLKEAVPTDGSLLTAESWRDYPILRFSEIPDVAVHVISDPGKKSTGVGEVALGPTAGAIGNAVAAALGMRLRDLPFTRERVVQALLSD